MVRALIPALLAACVAPPPGGGAPDRFGDALADGWVVGGFASFEHAGGGSAPTVSSETAPGAPTAPELSAELFSDAELPEFDVELSDDAIAALTADPSTYVEGALVYRGVRWEPVGVRVKGQNSFLPIDSKPSLKIKLDHYVPGWDLLGLEELTLNNMSNDPSMMHERVAYRLYREHGIPAARATHAIVRINGVERGLYTHVETVDENLLAQWYTDPTGPMWEQWDTDFTPGGVKNFQHEEGIDDRTALHGVAAALPLGGADGWAAAQVYLDGAEFLDYAAVSAVAAQFDSYPWWSPGDDCHWYQDPTTGLLQILPHGVDETFANEWLDFSVAYGLVLATCLADPACADDYADRIWSAQDTSEAIDLLGYAADVREQIRPLVEADAYRPYSLADVQYWQDVMEDLIEDRPEVITAYVGGP